MEQTKVVTTCVSKKETKHWNPEHPINTIIELEVPYGEDNTYWKLSGGTNIELNTCNQDAADMFLLGNEYEILISPVKSE